MIEAEVRAELEIVGIAVALQRGRLGDRGGGTCGTGASTDSLSFNGAASVIEAEASSTLARS